MWNILTENKGRKMWSFDSAYTGENTKLLKTKKIELLQLCSKNILDRIS